MPEPNTLQIFARSVHFDRLTTSSMWGYVIASIQTGKDERGQLYVSPASFPVRRDGRVRTRDDEVYAWDGDGVLLCSCPLAGLERVALQLWFIRDNRRLRELGAVLRDALDDERGARLSQTLTTAIGGTSPVAGAIFDIGSGVARFVAGLLHARRDGIKIWARGSLPITALGAAPGGGEAQLDRRWGAARSDRGYFETRWALRRRADPMAPVFRPTLPQALRERLGPAPDAGPPRSARAAEETTR